MEYQMECQKDSTIESTGNLSPELQDKLQALIKENEDLRKNLKQKSDSLTEYEETITEKDANLKDLKQDLHEMKETAGHLQSANKDSLKTIDELTNENVTMRLDIKKMSKELADALKVISEMNPSGNSVVTPDPTYAEEERSTLIFNLIEAKNDKIEVIEELEAKIQSQVEKNDHLERENEELTDKLNKIMPFQIEYTRMKDELADIKEQLFKKESEIQRVTAENESFRLSGEISFDSEKRVKELNAQSIKSIINHDDEHKKNSNLRTKNAQLKAENEHLKQEILKVTSSLKKTESELKECKSILPEKEQMIRDLQHEKREISNRCEEIRHEHELYKSPNLSCELSEFADHSSIFEKDSGNEHGDSQLDNKTSYELALIKKELGEVLQQLENKQKMFDDERYAKEVCKEELDKALKKVLEKEEELKKMNTTFHELNNTEQRVSDVSLVVEQPDARRKWSRVASSAFVFLVFIQLGIVFIAAIPFWFRYFPLQQAQYI